MYLLEETPKAQAMRRKIINLLQSGNKANFDLGCQRIEKWGMHEDFQSILKSYFERHFLKIGELENLYDFLLPFVKVVESSSYLKEALPNNLFLCKNLDALFLGRCAEVCYLPDEIGTLEKLSFFYMRNSQVINLPESVGNWKNLTHLTLSNNQLTSLPASAKNWVNLKTIDISGNPIPNLPAKLQKIYEIQNDWQELLAEINGT